MAATFAALRMSRLTPSSFTARAMSAAPVRIARSASARWRAWPPRKPLATTSANFSRLGLIDGARCSIRTCNVGGEARQRAGFVEADLHPLSQIEINERIAPATAILRLKPADAFAQKRKTVRHGEPERIRLGLEMGIERP
ncbi:hypothetical protein ACVOMS_32930 [Bradyrhizobium guangxiense]